MLAYRWNLDRATAGLEFDCSLPPATAVGVGDVS